MPKRESLAETCCRDETSLARSKEMKPCNSEVASKKENSSYMRLDRERFVFFDR